MDFSNIGDRLTKKIGPLPLWAWAAIIVGVGYVAYKFLGPKGSSSSDAAATDSADGTTPDDTSNPGLSFGSDLTSPSVGIPGSGGGTSLPPASYPIQDSSGIGLGSGLGSIDSPLYIITQDSGKSGTLYEGSTTSNPQDGSSGGYAEPAPAAPDNSRANAIAAAQGNLANAKAAEQAAQSELSAAKDAERAAQANLQAAKQSGKGVGAAQNAKDAAAARSGVAQANKDAAAAASGVAAAQLAGLG